MKRFAAVLSLTVLASIAFVVADAEWQAYKKRTPYLPFYVMENGKLTDINRPNPLPMHEEFRGPQPESD